MAANYTGNCSMIGGLSRTDTAGSQLNTNVLVTGAGGQLGRELQRAAPEGMTLCALARADLDLADAEAVDTALAELSPGVVINAAAYTAVDRAESEIERAHAGNVTGPANLALACARRGARLIHVSTDFVFDGQAGSPYTPDQATGPVSEYGRSKLAGELAVRDALPDALIVRTAWVYSAFGGNFVKTMLRLMGERDELGVVADQVGTPTWAAGLAQMLWTAAQTELGGTYHWSDAGACSWYDFACAISEEGQALGLLDSDTHIRPLTTADYPTPAQRPAYSVFDKTATWRDFDVAPIQWRRQLRHMLQDLKDMENA